MGGADAAVDTLYNSLTASQGTPSILTRFRLFCSYLSFSSYSNISKTARSASVPPHEVFSLLLPHSHMSNANTLPCRCQLMPSTGDCSEQRVRLAFLHMPLSDLNTTFCQPKTDTLSSPPSVSLTVGALPTTTRAVPFGSVSL